VESDFERVKKERNGAEKQYQQEKEWKEQAQSERNTLRERAATAESERTATVQEKEALSNSVFEERRARTRAESRAQEAEAIATELERKLDDAEIRAASYLRNWREIYSLYENVTAAMASTRTAANRMIDYLDSTSRSLPLPSAEPPPAGATGAQTAAGQVCPLLIIIPQMVQK
jgi:chromosome segregation ATPase